MFGIIRIIFWSIAFIICFLIIDKSKATNKRRWYLRSFIIAFILYTLSCFVPIENAFIAFSSPEAAFNYTDSDNVILVVEGEGSALVVGNEVSDIIPKSDTGWKFSLAWDDVKIIINSTSLKGIWFWVYQYKDSEDYYIMVSDPKGGAADVTDNRNSKFYHLKDSGDITYYTYYAYVHHLDDAYNLIVNGETIPVVDGQD